MHNNVLASLAAAAACLSAAPAMASGNWSDAVEACAAAAEAEGVVIADQYSAKFLYGGGASTKKLALKFTTDAGDIIEAHCNVRRGKVTDFGVKS